MWVAVAVMTVEMNGDGERKEKTVNSEGGRKTRKEKMVYGGGRRCGLRYHSDEEGCVFGGFVVE